jgi:hypothetical protein
LFGAIKRAVEALPFWVHVVIGSMILIAFVPLINPAEIWTSDEGAVRAQVEFIAADGSWSRVRPMASIDPEMVVSPIRAATIHGDVYYPYTKRPLYPMILVPIRSVFGQSALIGISLAGTVAAAIAGALIAGLAGWELRRTTFWVLAFASPLLIYAFTVTAHSVAAACGAFALVLVIRADRHVTIRVLLAMALLGVAVSLRVEAVAYGLAVAVAVVFLSRRDHDRSRLVAAAGIVIATVASHGVNHLWALHVAGVPPVSEGERLLSGMRLIRGSFSSLLLLAHHVPPLSVSAVALIAGGSVLFAIAVRTQPEKVALQRVLAGTCALGVALLVVAPPIAIAGFLVATPVLTIGMILIGRNEIRRPETRMILVLSLVFAVAVLATQESGGGGIQWGGRYLLPMVPLLVPIAVLAIHNHGVRLPANRSMLLSVVILTSIGLSVNGLLMLHRQHAIAVSFQEEIVAFARDVEDGDGGRPVLVSSNTHLGRHMWRTVEDIDYFLPPADRFEVYMQRFVATDTRRFGFLGNVEERVEFFEDLGYRVVTRTGPRLTVFERADSP